MIIILHVHLQTENSHKMKSPICWPFGLKNPLALPKTIIIYSLEICVQLFHTVLQAAIDFFSLYVLFSHFRPCDATRGNSFFQMSSFARANVRITNEKKTKQKANSHEGITSSEIGKLNTQAKESVVG